MAELTRAKPKAAAQVIAALQETMPKWNEVLAARLALTSNQLLSQIEARIPKTQWAEFSVQTRELSVLLGQVSEVMALDVAEKSHTAPVVTPVHLVDVLLASNKLMPAEQVCDELGFTRQALHKAVQAGRLFRFKKGRGYFYPTFFVRTPEPERRAILEKVSMKLGSLPSSAKWQFFNQASYALDSKSPLELLTQAKPPTARTVDAIVRLAEAFADL